MLYRGKAAVVLFILLAFNALAEDADRLVKYSYRSAVISDNPNDVSFIQIAENILDYINLGLNGSFSEFARDISSVSLLEDEAEYLGYLDSKGLLNRNPVLSRSERKFNTPDSCLFILKKDYVVRFALMDISNGQTLRLPYSGSMNGITKQERAKLALRLIELMVDLFLDDVKERRRIVNNAKKILMPYLFSYDYSALSYNRSLSNEDVFGTSFYLGQKRRNQSELEFTYNVDSEFIQLKSLWGRVYQQEIFLGKKVFAPFLGFSIGPSLSVSRHSLLDAPSSIAGGHLQFSLGMRLYFYRTCFLTSGIYPEVDFLYPLGLNDWEYSVSGSFSVKMGLGIGI